MDKIREEAERIAKASCSYEFCYHGSDCPSCKCIADTLEKLMRDKAELEKKLEIAREALHGIIDIRICDPSFQTWEEQSEREHARFRIAKQALKQLEGKE